MFEQCELALGTNKSCAFCGIAKGIKFCGLATDGNIISEMKICGKVKKEKKRNKKNEN